MAGPRITHAFGGAQTIAARWVAENLVISYEMSIGDQQRTQVGFSGGGGGRPAPSGEVGQQTSGQGGQVQAGQTQNAGQQPPIQPTGDRTMGARVPLAKEQKEVRGRVDLEKVPVVEVREEEKVPEEVESWLEKLEKAEDVQLKKPVTDDDGSTLLEPATPLEPQVVLPLTKDKVRTGLHHQIWESLRWLAEWCVRIIRKYNGKVSYREEHGRV